MAEEISSIAESFFTEGRREALGSLLREEDEAWLYGLAGSSASLLIAELAKTRDGIILVIGESLDDAGYLYHDLTRVLGEGGVAMFPSGYKRHIKYGQIDAASQILRTEALNRIESDSELKIVVSYPEALAEKTATKKAVAENTLRLSKEKETDLTKTLIWLREKGFKEVDYVYEPGQFASRGSILDIFSYSNELPYRLDFFGDEIDSIRTFDTASQLSVERLEEVTVTADVSDAGDGESLLDFISPETLIAARDIDYTLRKIEEIGSETFSSSAATAGEGDADAMKKVVDAEDFAKKIDQFRKIHFSSGQAAPAKATMSVDFRCSPQAIYHKNFDLISDSFKKLLAEGYKLFILSDSDKQIERLKAIFSDRGDAIEFTPVAGTLHEGFTDHIRKTCVFTDHQIFDRFHKYNLKSDKARSGKLALSLKELSSIEPGDYIVHTDHGVGKFAGLLRTNVNGRTQEMIKLTYSNNDTIFVSIHALHKLSKYRGKEGVPPKINKLGSGAWTRMKEKTKDKLKDIARNLIKLYAARKSEKGYSFSPDSYLQHELEASFIYEDTPDQLTATKAVKADMESDRPMDRLICGDVGFGKTEIAIRAAFKAAVDGKQTAILVPTTVLAYQHYNTLKNRLADFPVRVDYLSRARSPKQVKQILEDLAEGKIDIIIGTHKLIGKSVKFKDLGLLVIDEEQKFGVAVKEKLKQMKVNVDTLTMSATPIPRTLQFSVMGARDLSAITTPPANRYPIVTSIDALTDEIVSEAVNFEMSRNGQIFIVNPRIEGLNELENMVKRLVPDARTIVAHGQMPPEKLEKAIMDFSDHEYDVMLSTSIIENGVDMPRVNTIIINNAQNFGLSELHQLRGRVGRSSRKAFCYMLVPSHVPLTEVARRRLQAIENFSELGSGIHIAMQDLDIRGAGNLLGAEQSGFIADLGYETYQKILKEAVTELKNEEFAGVLPDNPDEEKNYVADCVIESDMELLLPSDYVPQESERISLYQELDSIEKERDLRAFRDRLRDRFGKLPSVAEELLLIPRLRSFARQLGIEKVVLKQEKMFIYFVDKSNVAYYQSPMFGKILRYVTENPRRCEIRQKGEKQSFLINDVKSVKTATEILSTMVSNKTI